MTTQQRRQSGLLVVLAIAAGVYAPMAVAQEPPKFKASPGKKIALDFAQSPGGGVPAGTFNNFGFALNPNEAVQTFNIKPDDPRKDVIATFDYAGCAAGQEPTLEKPVRELTRGVPAWVDYIDIEMAPQKATANWSGGVCFGYRRSGGGWRWNLASVPLVQKDGRVTGRIWVKEPNVDALKLVFDHSVPQHAVRRVVVTTQPIEVKPVK
jgi:hypothetical protein